MAQQIASLTEADRNAIIDKLSPEQCMSLRYEWRDFHARPDQVAPEGEWDIWILLAGRGFGKTRVGAEWVKEQVAAGARRIALIGETAADTRDVMVEGESGLLSVYPEHERPLYQSSKRQITWPNGAIAKLYNATEPDQLRGPQHDLAWSDELAKWRYARATWDQLQFGLRLGKHPRQIVTTTPRPIELVKAIVAGTEGKVHVTTGSTMDNRANLAPQFLDKILRRYEGTRLGRQELNAEILSDIPNALWTLDNIDAFRVHHEPDHLGRSFDVANLSRIVVSVDHAVSDTETSNEHGIVVLGQSMDKKEAYVLEDGSLQGRPERWAKRAISLFDRWEADAIVVEVNQGGDMVKHTLQSVRRDVPIHEVRATRGKHLRAEPVSSMYEQGRVHHCGSFPDLETQMCLMTNAGYEGEGSPDRVDALVAGIMDLFPSMTRPVKKAVNYEIPNLRRVG